MREFIERADDEMLERVARVEPAFGIYDGIPQFQAVLWHIRNLRAREKTHWFGAHRRYRPVNRAHDIGYFTDLARKAAQRPDNGLMVLILQPILSKPIRNRYGHDAFVDVCYRCLSKPRNKACPRDRKLELCEDAFPDILSIQGDRVKPAAQDSLVGRNQNHSNWGHRCLCTTIYQRFCFRELEKKRENVYN